MKILIAAVTVLALLAGCSKAPESAVQVNREFQVDRLFTYEGCTVFRFEDAGYRRYYTDCKGTTSAYQTSGKNCTRDTDVVGGKHD